MKSRKSQAISALAMNISSEDLTGDANVKFETWLIPFLLSTASWAYILVQMIFAYRSLESWAQITLTVIYAALYAGGFLFLTAFFSALLMWGVGEFSNRFYISMLASLPIVAVALISLVMKSSFQLEKIGVIKALGHFPEHPLVIGGYLTILSHVRLVSFTGKTRAILYLIVLAMMVYILLGPILLRLFRL